MKDHGTRTAEGVTGTLLGPDGSESPLRDQADIDRDACESKRDEYLAQPVNFGFDNPSIRLAEADAFEAGWAAALAHLGARS